MPRGAAVIRYEGVRGVVWRVKYRDADGRQVQETLGKAADGWNKSKAQSALRERLVAVEKDGRRKLGGDTFASFAQTWLDTYPTRKRLKTSTVEGYRQIIEKHLIPSFGPRKVSAIDIDDIEGYIARKSKTLGPRTINRHLNVLSGLFNAAIKRRPPLAQTNPVLLVERPDEPRNRWTILSPENIRAVEAAFSALIEEADGEERSWREQARVIFLTAVGTGLRRGELLGLRWRRIALADPDGARLRVEETWVRCREETPKSDAGERTITVPATVAQELWHHLRRSAFKAEDDRVFCSPTKGTPFDVQRYTQTFRLALSNAGITGRVRPFHDLRHSAITNDAAINTPIAVMKRAGHSNFKTTETYIDLAGEAFRAEAMKLDARLFGDLRGGQTEAAV